METLQSALMADLKKIRSLGPLVLNLTNSVAMDITANALLALGASPIMSLAEEELPELVSISNSIVINMGTLDKSFIRAAKLAIKHAQKLSKPVVFDPVGVGASQFRTQFGKEALQTKALTIVRGNASEIGALLDFDVHTKGVDSTISIHPILESIRQRISKSDPVFVASGRTDYIFSADRIASSAHGVPMMTQVTAMGCTATSLLGAFIAVSETPFTAALHTMIVMGIAGELAANNCKGPGSFRLQFLDALSQLKNTDFCSLKVSA